MGDLSNLLLEIFQAPEVDLAASWREPLKPGDVVGRYQIRREIGRGGFGAVYEAFDTELGRAVALKALKPGRSKHPISEEWIKKEAEAVAKLDHPAIVTIFDVGTCPAGAYLVMELLRGETLARRIEKGPLPVDEALRVAEQMAEGLAHAHSRGVLHRDLKPANVFVCEDGRVKLLDFGLAHLLGTEGSSGAGTPAYMAPEQAAGAPVDERADVWAAGMVLGEMLTGKRPVERTPSPEARAATAEPKTALMWEAPRAAAPATAREPKLAGVPRPVANVLGVALSEDPGERPKDGGSWLSEVRSARLRVDRPRRIRRIAVLAGIGVAVGLTLAGFATWRVWERQIPGGRPTVAVADFTNETGDSELDGISGLLITSLEQGTQFRVLTRSRMLDLLKQLGKGTVERIDEPLAREVGREARASALLLASVRKLGESYVVEMRALDPLHDEYVFTVSERTIRKEGIFDLVDRLGQATRRRLGGESEAAPTPSVASITTKDPRAWDLLFRGRQAFDRLEFDDARRHFEASLEVDPEFALARFQLASLQMWIGDGLETNRAASALETAWDLRDRLPEKERLALRAMRAQLAGDRAEAIQLRDQAAAAYPLDKEALFYAGDVRFHMAEQEASIPFFERTLQIDPDYGLALAHLLHAYEGTGTAGTKAEWLRRQAARVAKHLDAVSLDRVTPRRPSHATQLAMAVSETLLAAGLEEEAVALGKRATAASGWPWPPPPFVGYLMYTGRGAEAESDMRRSTADAAWREAAPPRWVRLYEKEMLASSFMVQGRLREAQRDLTGSETDPVAAASFRQCFGLAARSKVVLRASTEELVRMGVLGRPGWGAITALVLAEAGEISDAMALAAQVRRDGSLDKVPPFLLAVLEALSASGPDPLGAAASAMRGAKTFDLDQRYQRLIILGEIERARKRFPEAIAALEEARTLPYSMQLQEFFWTQPGVLHSLSLSYEMIGDIPKARERNSEMLIRWEKADEDIPLLVEAKAMRERLAVK